MPNAKRVSVWALLAAGALLVPVAAWAQRGGGMRGGGGGMRGGGFGGGMRGGFGGMHGGFRGGGFSGGGIRSGGFRSGFVGGHVGGFRGGFVGHGFISHGGFGRAAFFPHHRAFFFPRHRVFFGNSFFFGAPAFGFGLGFASWPYYSWPPPYYDPPYDPYYYGSGYAYDPPPAAPPVVVERDPYDYRPAPRGVVPVPAAERYWLLAFHDHSIRAVTDYWLDGNTLNYVTRDGVKSSAELSSVDIPFTKQLNRERGLEFRLPRSSGSGNGNGDGEYQPRRLDSFGRSYQ